MKTLCLVLVSVVVGAVLGFATVEVQLRRWPVVHDAADAGLPGESAVAGKPTDGGGAPKASVDQEHHDFGALEIGVPGAHDFIITNAGSAPLQLTPGGTSCSCTSNLFEGGTLAPGQSEAIRVEWETGEFAGPFEQHATIYTNDPQRSSIRLEVTGRYTSPVEARPRRIEFSSVTVGVEASGESKILGFLDEPLQIEGYELQDEEHFEATFRPLGESELEDDATSGVLARVVVKPGLPIGSFQDTLVLKTNCAAQPELEIGIEGRVQSQITISGPFWDRDSMCLRVGHVTSGTKHERTLMIRSGGADAESIEFEVADVEPEWLQVSLGEAYHVANAASRVTPLKIVIPSDAPPSNFKGTAVNECAKIRIKTNDPASPELQILVEFAVSR